MNDQLKKVVNQAWLNFAILGGILIVVILGKLVNPELTNTIFVTADQLVSDVYLVFIAITLGVFIPKFKLVVIGALVAFIATAILIQVSVLTYLTTTYLFAVLIVTLGFASIANLYRHYRESNDSIY